MADTPKYICKHVRSVLLNGIVFLFQSSRWALVCSLCRERTGACIQCSVKTCKTAFHVTCAFDRGLDMKTILDEDHDDVQLKVGESGFIRLLYK